MAGSDLKSIVDRIVDLPTLPQVVTTIMGLLDDPDSSARDVNDVMANDPALVAKILKLVNSVFYGLPNRVSSIQQSIAILGFNTIKSLAISASVFDLFGDGDESFSYEGFWTHSIGTATIARYFGKHEPAINPDTAFVSGLLHNMGKLVLDQYAPMEFQEILARAKAQHISFAKAEQGTIETSYTEIGYWLANKWQLAEDVQNPIMYQNRIHECPEKDRPVTAAVAFASYLCRARNYGTAADFDKPSVPRGAWDTLHIERDKLPVLIEEIDEELERAGSFLSVINS